MVEDKKGEKFSETLSQIPLIYNSIILYIIRKISTI
jgi:hypothetical protein